MKKKLLFTNLQLKVMLLFVLVALAPLCVVGTLAMRTAEELITGMATNQIEHVVADKAALLERWIQERKADLELVAGSSLLRSLDPEQISPFIELVRNKYRVYGTMVVVSRDGRIVYDTSRKATNPHGETWFRDALAGKPYLSDITFDAEKKESFFWISTPMHDAMGAVIGVVCARVGTGTILSLILRVSLGETGECYLVNRDGTFLAHKEPNRILNENIAQSESFKNILNSGKRRSTYIDYRGVEVMGASARVGGTEWALVVEQDREEAFHDADRLRHYIYLVASFSACGALALAWLLSLYVVNPIRKLSTAAAFLSKGEFEKVELETRRSDEIGLLYGVFGEMTRQLENRQVMLEQRVVLKEAELEETGAKLKETERAAARSQQLASLGRLAAGVAHEIRTPLTSLKLFLESVESEIAISADYEEDFQVAMNQVKRMEATISRFLDFARPQDPVFSLLDAGDLIEEALLVVGPKARQQETLVRKSVSSLLPKIRGDRRQLGEALLNLMVNGLEAMTNQGELTVTAHLVEFQHANGRRKYVQINVSDTGPGIPEANVPRLFDPFFTTKATGAGLGLSIVSSTIHRHGGEVEVESSVGQGTTFSIQIPAEG